MCDMDAWNPWDGNHASKRQPTCRAARRNLMTFLTRSANRGEGFNCHFDPDRRLIMEADIVFCLSERLVGGRSVAAVDGSSLPLAQSVLEKARVSGYLNNERRARWRPMSSSQTTFKLGGLRKPGQTKDRWTSKSWHPLLLVANSFTHKFIASNTPTQSPHQITPSF